MINYDDELWLSCGYGQPPSDLDPASIINLALLNVRSLANKSFLMNDLIIDYKLDLDITETWLDMSNTATLI